MNSLHFLEMELMSVTMGRPGGKTGEGQLVLCSFGRR